MEDITTDFIYARLHGANYKQGYPPEALQRWAEKLRAWGNGDSPASPQLISAPAPSQPQGRDVFAYFDNEDKIRAPHEAQTVAHLLGIGPAPPPFPEKADSSEEELKKASQSWQALRQWRAGKDR
jgi:uncharacterized protein YecE (DUF72 family)